MSIRRFAAAILLAATAISAAAFERSFPVHVQRGKMTPANYPVVLINGAPMNLSAGARIFNRENLIEQPVTLRGKDIVVNYTINEQGDVDRIWILRPEEAAQALPK
jgi:hypothetical protein